MAEYRLTKRAAEDIADIAAFGIERFGQRQARLYREGLRRRLERIAERPLLYPAVDHVRPGYRLSVYESHAIYFRITEYGVLVVRILGRQAPRLVEDAPS